MHVQFGITDLWCIACRWFALATSRLPSGRFEENGGEWQRGNHRSQMTHRVACFSDVRVACFFDFELATERLIRQQIEKQGSVIRRTLNILAWWTRLTEVKKYRWGKRWEWSDVLKSVLRSGHHSVYVASSHVYVASSQGYMASSHLADRTYMTSSAVQTRLSCI